MGERRNNYKPLKHLRPDHEDNLPFHPLPGDILSQMQKERIFG